MSRNYEIKTVSISKVYFHWLDYHGG